MNKNKFENIWNQELETAINKVDVSSSKFKIVPVPPKEFFEIWMKMPLFPRQYSMVNNVFTPDFKDWDRGVHEIMLMYGEGGGKDTLTTRSLCYCAYWLLCLNNPQEYLQSGSGTPIVLLNCSFKEEHASGIFFKQFTNCLRQVINPSTGHNWFEEQGMDLREGKNIQNRKVVFPNHIEADSESSVRYSAEGKNVLLAVFDEIAEFRYDKAKVLYENMKNTAFSRFANYYKIVSISYPRDEYDYFCTIYNAVDSLPQEEVNKVFRDKAASWEVRCKEEAHPSLIENRIYRVEEDYSPFFRSNPEDAMRRYKCEFPTAASGKYLKKFELVLEKCVNFERPSPILWDSLEDREFPKIYVTEKELVETQWQPWFKPSYSYEAYQIEQELVKNPTNEELHKRLQKELERHEGTTYFIHVDLSQGLGDCAGITIMHPYLMTPSITGYYVDLTIQIRPEEDEINFDYIKQFIFKLSSLGFDIDTCTFDGFQCLTGDTQIKLVNGKNVPIKELVGSSVEVYSYDINNKNIISAVANNIRKTSEKSPVFKITLDNNQFFKATASHPLLMRDGSYKKVCDLYVNDSLMPLYTKISTHKGQQGYELLYLPEQGKWAYTHRHFMKGYTPLEYPNKFHKGYYIHHKNFNKLDNSFKNLQWLTKKEHITLHALANQKANIIRFKQRAGKSYEEIYGEVKGKQLRDNLSIINKGKLLKEGTYQACLTCKNQFRAYPARIRSAEKGNMPYPKYCSQKCMSIGIKNLWSQGRYANRNHKVTNIEFVGYEDIYDLEVPGYNNFALSAGVFVHNSVYIKQLIQQEGIKCEIISVDRTRKPYDTLKGLLYQGKLSLYDYLVPIRELKELIVSDNSKVDHPKESNQRLKEEGKKNGSKDIADGLAATVYAAVMQEAESGPSCVDTSESEEDHLDDPLSGLRRRSRENIEESEENNENL